MFEDYFGPFQAFKTSAGSILYYITDVSFVVGGRSPDGTKLEQGVAPADEEDLAFGSPVVTDRGNDQDQGEAGKN